MRKRILSLVMICGLLFTATACGNYNIEDGKDPPENTEENPFTKAEEDGSLGLLSREEGLKMKTKFMCIMLILAFALNLSACGISQENVNSSENASSIDAPQSEEDNRSEKTGRESSDNNKTRMSVRRFMVSICCYFSHPDQTLAVWSGPKNAACQTSGPSPRANFQWAGCRYFLQHSRFLAGV